jgi:hypothetical protein
MLCVVWVAASAAALGLTGCETEQARLEEKAEQQALDKDKREWTAKHPGQTYYPPDVREQREWSAKHPGEKEIMAVGMALPNRRDPLIETPLGIMRKSDYQQLLKEEQERRARGGQ